MKDEPILWMDIETTGLLPEKHHILEVSAVVTNDLLEELDSYSGVIHWHKEIIEEMDNWCRTTHSASGLMAAVISSDLTGRDVEDGLLMLIDRNFDQHTRPVLAGSSIHFDRMFIRKYMPRLDRRMHYRMLDVSSFTEAYRLLFHLEPDAAPTLSTHRSAADVRRSISQMKEHRGRMKWGVSL